MPSTGTHISPDAALQTLRQTVARIDTAHAVAPVAERALSLGQPEIDHLLGGGLARGAMHEVAPTVALHLGAATGFTLALAVLAVAGAQAKDAIWIQTDFAAAEAGPPYGPGLDAFGLASERLVVLRVPRAIDVLWAMEEALKHRAPAAVIAELTDDAADLTATRRLALAARHGDGLGLLLRHRATTDPSAAMTRWEVAATAGPRDAFGGLGATTFALSLVRNRRGPAGRFTLSWDHHARVFVAAAVSRGVAETACDRPARAPLVRAG
jgi:protein ImuA